MAKYKAPLRDMRFVLNEVFEADKLWAAMPATQEVTPDLVDAILEEGAKVTENELFPLNRTGDEEGCQFSDGDVTTPAGFKDAYNLMAESGWMGLGGNPEMGGQGMPKMLTVLFEEMLYSANASFALYPALNSGAALCLDNHADEAMKEQLLPAMYEGRWLGTMCLTEPHSGTDLGLIRTKAEPNADGSYKVSGTKIFITGGEHDLCDNIIHLVLAKLPDAPAGSRGISLFMVPKFLINEDGSLGERNPAFCGSIEHKMGIKGSATCVMNFDGAQGWMIGEPNKGLACMFTMMNYERLSIGIQGLGLGEVAYQSAMDFAQERIQSRAPGGAKYPEKAADNILVHPDVRRMALNVRAFNEAGRAFASYVAMQLDTSKYHEDEATRKKAAALVALLTPVAKSYLTDRGLDCTITAQQIYGGQGYIREWGAEQYVRDARIAQIYEGTNGIQALDLMGRKVVSNNGEYLKLFAQDIQDFIESNSDNAAVQPYLEKLGASLETLMQVTGNVITRAKDNPAEVGAASQNYLDLFGLVTYAYLWARMVAVAAPKAEADTSGFYSAKVKVANYFFARILPEAAALAAQVNAGADTLMDLEEELFYGE
ncbi:acyl-CoA dehydrogenase C-terminal domain-containing protein [Oceanospirillum sediminis]|uniref:3-methylmercaptopropionyl-CoA dehydrogenase n=1 Tax=Oceanospirillum sediminis TaxID=2760088 RepID=A0A839ILM2_9GAMM|nr:acyl-CoA dehydrogenase C-terminal domain-containing protein [Oceanospirillum sediminis]MBB1485600.1 acyl-CoA dehydrogenase C-terminal domain-containing protein [Oceanospirillum sediminis]